MLRKLGRVTFNMLAALSVALCLAACVMWVRGRAAYDLWQYQTAGDALYSVLSVHGDLFLSSVDRRPSPAYPAGLSHGRHAVPKGWDSWTGNSPQPAYTYRRFGVGVIRGGYFRKVVIAYRLLVPLLTVLPTLWLIRRRLARRRSVIGLCGVCGYDLRATPGRCPECGTECGTEPAR